MSRSHKTSLIRFFSGLAMVAVAIAFGWALQPKDIEAAGPYQREVVEISGRKAPTLGMLQGRSLGIRVLPGENGPRYQVLDQNGLILGVYDSEAAMVAGFEQLGDHRIRADVPEFSLDP